ncbi:TPR-like protein [Trametes coccinea BRFM310]|uniref:TPR-like protein n=1 Tax=Trametes coccinea (strain BRFM310) TaxID=1353009 RepID=A0A1Y2ITU1_TRAC3|nr:TPR-like protein [Trametes coccinea BRFM310]
MADSEDSKPHTQADELAAGSTPASRDLHDESLSEDAIRKCLSDADALKQEGNEHFRRKQWDQALASYRAALGRLPKRRDPPSIKDKGKSRAAKDEEGETPATDSEEPSSSDVAASQEEHDEPAIVLTGVELECAKARAVLNANIGACFVKLGEHKEVVSACTEALRDDPDYIKALQRRAVANEAIDSWSSLSSAQEDYKRLLELLPSRSPELVSIRRTLAALPPRIEAAQKRETAEMLDKLKGLGNQILGNFGLSTDNFQFVPNGQGGYSMNFVR